MGFFTKNEAPGGALPPLTQDRVAATFDRRGEHYGRNDSGQLGGFWDGHLYLFLVLDEGLSALQVRARWNRELPVSEYDPLLETLNTWSRDKIWPKVYAVKDRLEAEPGLAEPELAEPNNCSVFAEFAVNYPHGLTDEQIDEHIACALGTIGQFFDHLDALYPDQAARARAELERQEREGGA